MKCQQIRQTIAPSPFTTEKLSESHWKSVKAELSNEFVVLRYLTSKIVFTEEVVSEEEKVALFLSFENVVAKIARDEGCRRKYGSEVFTFRAIYQDLDHIVRMEPELRHNRLETKYNFYRGKLFSRRYFYSVRGQLQRLYQIRLQTRFPRKFAPKAFVGKGYGDHGTAKNAAIDGSPDWKEVAMTLSEQEIMAKTRLDRELEVFRSFRVHQNQINY